MRFRSCLRVSGHAVTEIVKISAILLSCHSNVITIIKLWMLFLEFGYLNDGSTGRGY